MTQVNFQDGGALLATSPSYIKRNADEKLQIHLARMEYVTLVEPRQQGKTSLINRLIGISRNQEYAFAYADLTTFDKSNERDWYESLCDWLLRSMWFIPDADRPCLPHNSNTWRNFLAIVAEFAASRTIKLVIVLDEVGATPEPWATNFFSVIRSVYNSRQNMPCFLHLTFIVAGAYNPKDLIRDKAISNFNVDHRISLDDFSLAQVSQLVKHLNIGIIDTKIGELLYSWTGGQPFLCQRLCVYLAERGLSVTLNDVDAAVDRFFREDTNHLRRILSDLHVNAQLSNYVHEIIAKPTKYTPAINDWHFQLSHVLGIIAPDQEGLCKIRNRIYERALESNAAFYSNALDMQRDRTPSLKEKEGKNESTPVKSKPEPLQTEPTLVAHTKGDWTNFKLQLTRQARIRFEARAIDTPMGEPRSISRLPFDTVDLILVLKVLENSGYDAVDFTPAQMKVLQRLGLIRDGRLVPKHLQRIGKKLYDALFTDDVRSAFQMSFNQSRGNRQRLTLQLRFDANAANLASYPWELLHDGERHLISSGVVEIVRYITYHETPLALPVESPARLLFIESRPKDLVFLQPEGERLAVWNALQPLDKAGKLIMERLETPTYEALTAVLSRTEYHLIHFDGHGLFAKCCPQCNTITDSPNLTTCHNCQRSLGDVEAQGYLIFEDEDNEGHADFVSTKAMENLLSNSQVRLIFLSACKTGTVNGDSLFGGMGPGLIRAGVPAVVAMQFAVSLETTLEFAGAFYDALAQGETISRAVAQGRQRLFRKDTWFIPTLYLRSQDDEGHLLAT